MTLVQPAISVARSRRSCSATVRRRDTGQRSRPPSEYYYTTQQKADDIAVLWCDVIGKTNDCRLVTSGLGCLSIAESSDGKTLAARQAFTQDAAHEAAHDGPGLGPATVLTGAAADT